MLLFQLQRAAGDVLARGLVKQDRRLGEVKLHRAIHRIVHIAKDHGGQHGALHIQLDGGFHTGRQGGIHVGMARALVADADILGADTHHHVLAGQADGLLGGKRAMQRTEGQLRRRAVHLGGAVDEAARGVANAARDAADAVGDAMDDTARPGAGSTTGK